MTSGSHPVENIAINKKVPLLCLVLALVVLAVYLPVKGFDFVNYDDNQYVYRNFIVQEGIGIKSLVWALFSTYAANWHPVTWFSHMLDCHLFDLEAGWHHLSSVAWHAGNAVLLFIVLFRMTGRLWRSLFVSAVFALHPVNVDSVAWIAQRKNLVSTFFWLAVIGAYWRYTRQPWFGDQPSNRWYILVCLLFIFGLMAKPMLVSLPIVLLLLDYWPLHRYSTEYARAVGLPEGRVSIRQIIYEKAPLFVLAFVFSLTTMTTQKGAMARIQVSWGDRVANALVAYTTYMVKMLWPQNLAVFYPHPGTVPWKEAAVSLAVLVMISVLAVLLVRRRPYLFVGWFWFLVTLVPVIGLVQVGRQAMADRYAYVPFIGLFIILAWGLPDLLGRWRHKRAVLVPAAICVLAVLAPVTRGQLSHWRDSAALFSHALKVTSRNYVAHVNLGLTLARRGRIKEAVRHFEFAIGVKPDMAQPHFNLGDCLMKQGRMKEAIYQYARALAIDPDMVLARNRLGVALALTNRPDQAELQFRRAIREEPRFVPPHANLGRIYLIRGQAQRALEHFYQAVEINPADMAANQGLEEALLKIDDPEAMLAALRKEAQQDPENPEWHYRIGNLYKVQGDLDEAQVEYQMAIILKSDFNPALNNLARVYFEKGLFTLAEKTFLTLVGFRRDSLGAYVHLACLYSLRNDKPRSAEMLERAWLSGLDELETLTAARLAGSPFPDARGWSPCDWIHHHGD